ncbi:MAG: acyl-CoA dehydrogenase family protein [Myxococcota bacterium]
MELSLTEAQEKVRARARSLAADVLAPRAEAHDQAARFPEEQVRALAADGLMTMLVPEDDGGSGMGTVAYSLAITEVARACASTSVTMAVTNMVADAISAWGNDEQKAEHIPKLGSSEYLAGSFCLSEPNAGSDAASLKATAVRHGDTYVLNGSKVWITSGDRAGVFLVMAKTDPSARSKGISTFLVHPELPGFSVGKHEEKMGLRASSTVTLSFDNVEIPAANRLGPEGIGFKIAMRALDGGRVGIGSQALGLAEAALEAVKEAFREHASLRTDAALARLADLHTKVEAARMLVYRAAVLKERGDVEFTKEASMAKLYASETANAVCAQAIELVGPDAYATGSKLERVYRDVRVTTIYEGTSEIQRLVIARQVLA